MSKKDKKYIFLSARVPIDDGDEFSETRDFIAIRDAVRALATVVIGKAVIVHGGEPAITRLLHQVMTILNSEFDDGIILYQSDYFANEFSDESEDFVHKVITPKASSKEESLALMRKQMIESHSFFAGMFIGGEGGVKTEFDLFRKVHPESKLFPIASTGGASRIIFEESEVGFDSKLLEDLAYMSLFNELLDL